MLAGCGDTDVGDWQAATVTTDAADGSEVAGAIERRQSHAQASTSGMGSWRALLGSAGAALGSRIEAYFHPLGGGKQQRRQQEQQAPPGSILAFLKAPDGGAAALRSAPGAQQAKGGSGKERGPSKQGEWAHKGAAGEGGGGGGRRTAAAQPLRAWQLVPGTPFVVDRFNNLPGSLPQHRHWFLTHFHADHYKGLTSR